MATGAISLYLGAWGLSPLVMRGTRTDLDIFFWPVAQLAAGGHALSIYSGSFGGYPDANGPLSLAVLAPLAAVANALGWGDPRVAAAMVAVVAGALGLLIAREAVRLVEMARGRVDWRLAGYAVFALTPPMWIAVAGFGHIEQLIEVYVALRSARAVLKGRMGLGGVWFGLAVLARTAASTLGIPLLLAAARLRRGGAARFAIATCAAATLLLAPFVIADPAGVLHALVTYRGNLPIGGGSVWVTLYRSPIGAVVEQADGYVTLVVAGTVCLLIVRRCQDCVATAPGLLGLLTIAASCFPMLAKTVHSYYLFEPCILGTAWWLAQPGTVVNRRMAVPALLIGGTFMAEWSAGLPLTGIGAVEGVLSSLTLAAVIAVVAVDLLRSAAPEPQPLREAAAAAPANWR